MKIIFEEDLPTIEVVNADTYSYGVSVICTNNDPNLDLLAIIIDNKMDVLITLIDNGAYCITLSWNLISKVTE